MITHYHANPRLQSVRISSRCYTLLDTARIAPEHLENFYTTYRLPRDPFFPLFFLCKRAYLAERERIRQARRHYIIKRMRSLPEPVLRTIRYLGYLERSVNYAGESPLWQKHLFPGSKKQADAYLRRSSTDWQLAVRTHLSTLRSRYPRLKASVTDHIAALSILELLPDVRQEDGHASVTATTALPAHEIQTSYRRLSLIHHPDRGGDAQLFITLKEARDYLLQSR